VIEILLYNKADVNVKDLQGQTPLHLACLQNQNKISKLLEDIHFPEDGLKEKEFILCNKLSQIIDQIEQTKIIELLLSYKSNVNAKNVCNETPIFYLYKNNFVKITSKMKNCGIFKNVMQEFYIKRKKILNILLDYNIDLTIINDIGETILHLIANNNEFNDNLKEELSELILNKGADVNAKTESGLTPLHIAAENGHTALIKLFLKFDANIDAVENTEECIPLHLATLNQQVKAMKMLLENGADVNATKCNGMNVLHIMALINPEISKESEFIENYHEIIKTFLKYGCDINAQDIFGRTPLHLSSLYLNDEATWSFLQHFADINIEDCGGLTPLSFPINNTNQSQEIFYMFMDYVILLKMTGLHVTEKTNSCYLKLYGKLDLPDPEDYFLFQCKEEIEKMKSLKINNFCSLYDIIFKNSNEMEVYAGNELFEKILNSNDFDKNFNIYGNLLKSQFQKGLEKKVLLKSAKESFEFMLGFGIPDSCSDKIFQYLNNKSLRNLIKTKGLKVSSNKINRYNSFGMNMIS
jgi:ankyrin repeat protein